MEVVPADASAAGRTGRAAAVPVPASASASFLARGRAATALAAHPTAFRAGRHDAFVPRGRTVIDRDGAAHVRYDRTYRGLPVLGGDVIVHLARDGSLKGESLTLARPLNLAVSPSVTRTQAVRTAVAKLGTVSSSSARLVVDAVDSNPALAWEVTVTGVRRNQTPSKLHVVVDATTGMVRRSADEVMTASGKSIYSGLVTIGTTGSPGNYQERDPLRGGNYTTNLGHTTTGAGTLFTDADDVWGDGTQSDPASAGVDAHYGAQLTWDYYKNIHKRLGIWNNGTGVRSRVHYGNAYVNAFWDGTQMTYGDGTNNAQPLTEIDVAAHEMTHGVTQATANLTYSGESGGLNEATSDIFGTSVEFYANNPTDVGDYLIGEKINVNGTPLRYMDRPSRDGSSPNCWSPGIGKLNVHNSSGPANHAFYLMSEGSGAKTVNGVSYNSPTCNGSIVFGIGRPAAEKIWYRALTTYMTSGTGYAAARTAAINAATDLYGSYSYECAGVADAFSAIGVPGTTCAVKASGNPVLLQSRYGTKGNFELVFPVVGGGMSHMWRHNDVVQAPWSAPTTFGQGLGQVDAVTMIQSNYGTPGNLEVVALVGDTLQYFWRGTDPRRWNGPQRIATGAAGPPALIQSRIGTKGNFELVFPAVGGGISHMYRNNDAPGTQWSAPLTFGQGLGRVDAVTMVQSNYGTPGNLEVVALVGDTLQYFSRDSGPAFKWNGPYQIATGAVGAPVLVQSRIGLHGNFELAFPAASGGISHMFHDNDALGAPWSAPTTFGQGLGHVDAMSMIQSNYDTPGNLEVIARVGDTLHHFWRDSSLAFSWVGAVRLL